MKPISFFTLGGKSAAGFGTYLQILLANSVQTFLKRRNEMEKIQVTNYAFFGVAEPANNPPPLSQYLFAVATLPVALRASFI